MECFISSNVIKLIVSVPQIMQVTESTSIESTSTCGSDTSIYKRSMMLVLVTSAKLYMKIYFNSSPHNQCQAPACSLLMYSVECSFSWHHDGFVCAEIGKITLAFAKYPSITIVNIQLGYVFISGAGL